MDHQVASCLGKVSCGRLHTVLEAAIIQADPVGAEQQAAAAAQERFARLGRSNEHGLKLIIARATAGDAIWFKATIDRIADILAKQGDPDPVQIRRSTAIGILAQPAHALELLCEHQDDDWDGPEEPADIDTSVASEGDTHRSLQISPPPFHPERARPRAVIYVHLAAEALTAGTGIARVENVGPVLLGRLQTLLGDHCAINLKPVIDLPAGHIPVDSYEIPASLREQILLRSPADVFPYAAAVSRCIDVDHTIPHRSPDRRRSAGPNQNRQPRTPHPTESQTQDPRSLAGSATRTRHLAMAITIPLASTSSTPEAPTPSATPTSPRQWRAAGNPTPAIAN